MDRKKEILDALKVAMKTTYYDYIYFTADRVHFNIREYLLTVNAAKEIRKHQLDEKIFIEYDTDKFSTDCVPEPTINMRDFDFQLDFPTKENKDTKRSGKIDIAIYSYNTERNFEQTSPLCAIEVKAKNPSKQNILKDLKRNLEYFNLTSHADKSSIQFTFFMALKLYTNVSNEKIDDKIEKVKNLYEKYIKELEIDKDVYNDIEVFKVNYDGFEPKEHYIKNEVEPEGYEDKLLIGVIVTFWRNEKNKG